MASEAVAEAAAAAAEAAALAFAATAKRRENVDKSNIDLVLFTRKKKFATVVPLVPAPHNERLRVSRLSDEDLEHLMKEVQGPEFGPPARPELELQLVGVGAQEEEERYDAKGKEIPTDRSEGNGIGVLFDAAKGVYIISDSLEDSLLLLLRNDFQAAMYIDSASSKAGDKDNYTVGPSKYPFPEAPYLDEKRQRLWRRFVRIHLLPQMKNEERFLLIAARYEETKRKLEEANRVREAGEFSDEPTDSDEDSTDRRKRKEREKREKAAGKRGAGKGGKGGKAGGKAAKAGKR